MEGLGSGKRDTSPDILFILGTMLMFYIFKVK